MEKSLVLGIEGGGTKTEWVLLADGVIRTSGILRASNLRLVDDATLREIFRCLPRIVTHVGAFLAGCATDTDRARLRGLVREFWPDAGIAVGSDRESGMAVALQGQDGITVIAGTGSAVSGRHEGKSDKAAGWGQLLGDRGGGYDLAMQGLRQVLESYDLDHQVTSLGEAVLRSLSLNRLEELVSWVQSADKMSVARLAPVVFEAARAGDEEMMAVIQAGAKMLSRFTCAVANRLEFDAPLIKLLGGIFVYHHEYVDLFRDYTCDLIPGATIELCSESGALGAAWLAHPGLAPAPAASTPSSAPDTAELAAASTEQRNPNSAQLDQLSTSGLVDLFIAEEHHVIGALDGARRALEAAIDLASEAVRTGGRLFYAGAGTSGRLGVLDASEIPPTFGASPELVQGIIAGGVRALYQAVEGAEDQPEQGASAVGERGLRSGDVLCGIAASGRTPFVLGALERARELGARTILLSCNPSRNPSIQPWDVEIDLATGPEIVTGSTRLKAGTATKLVLNMLSTCAMIRLGKVRGNLMIDVSVSNAKLRDRAVRLVTQVRGCTYEEAKTLLEASGWRVREALETSEGKR